MTGEVQDSVAAYLAAPAFPGEEALQQGLKKRMADLRSILTQYVGLLRAGQCETARELEEGGFSRVAAQGTAEFGNLVHLNPRQGGRAGIGRGRSNWRDTRDGPRLGLGEGTVLWGGGRSL